MSVSPDASPGCFPSQYNSDPAAAGNAWANEASNTLFGYDTAGRHTLQVDENGVGVEYAEIDLASGLPKRIRKGNVKKASEAGGNEFEAFTYDSAGQVLTETVWKGNETSYSYDAFGRITEEVIHFIASALEPAATAVRTWTYEGTEQTFQDRDGRKTVTVTDPTTGMIDSFWYAAGYEIPANSRGDFLTHITTTLNSAGQVISVEKTSTELTDYTATTTFKYDEFGRLIKEVQSGSLDVEGDAGIATDKLPTTTFDRDYGKNGALFISQVTVKTGTTFNGVVSVQKYVTDNYGRVITATQDLKAGANPNQAPAPDPTTNTSTIWSGGSVGQDKRAGFIFNPDGTIRKVERFDDLQRTVADVRGVSEYYYESPDGSLSKLTHKRDFGWLLAQYITQFTTSADQSAAYTPPIGKLKSVAATFYGNQNNNIIDQQSSAYTYDEFGQVSEITKVVNGVSSTTDTGFDAKGNRASSDYKFTASNRLIEDAAYTYKYNKEGQLIERAAKQSTQIVDIQSSVSGFWFLPESNDVQISHDVLGGNHGVPEKRQSVYSGTEYRIKQGFQVFDNGYFDLWFTFGALDNGASVPYKITVDDEIVVTGVVDFSQSPGDAAIDSTSWLNLGRVRITGAIGGAASWVEIVLEKTGANGSGSSAWDSAMITPSSPKTEYIWNHQGQLVMQTTRLAAVNSDTVMRVEFAYDALGRLIARKDRNERVSGAVVRSRFASYANDGQAVALEFDGTDKITRSFFNSPTGGTPLAVDQAGASGNRTAWYFTDMSGDVRSVMAHDGGIQILHRQFTETGTLERQIGATANTTVANTPVF